MSKQPTYELRIELRSINAKIADLSTPLETRVELRKQKAKLQARIANRERYQAMRDLGLVKTPWGWE